MWTDGCTAGIWGASPPDGASRLGLSPKIGLVLLEEVVRPDLPGSTTSPTIWMQIAER